MTEDVAARPPKPVPDEVSAPFWQGLRERALLIQRCEQCGWFAYPPAPACPVCGTAGAPFVPVSGRGTVFSYSEMRSGARHPYFVSITPYLVGIVELEEQEGLYMWTNFPGTSLAEMSIGAAVEIAYQDITPDCTIPQFRLAQVEA